MNVSVLILTHNEGANLPACLDALSWCDDVVVVDSGSTDETVGIAAAYGARIMTRSFDNFAGQRNFGLERTHFRNDWVLHLDADEIVSDAFATALRGIAPGPEVDAYRVPFKTFLFGKWLKHAGMWPGFQVRLGHARRLRFVQVGHGQREDVAADRLRTFPEPLLHYSFSHGLRHWLEKHVRYARDEASLIADDRSRTRAVAGLFSLDKTTRRRSAKTLAARLPSVARPIARFVYIYLCRRGFLDGTAGFAYAFMLSTYEAMTALFLLEQTTRNGSNRIPRDCAKSISRSRESAPPSTETTPDISIRVSSKRRP